MKLIQPKHRTVKALSVTLIIAISIIYNSNYSVELFGLPLSSEQDNKLNIASEKQNSSFEKMTEITKTVIISGIKQLTSNH